MGPNRTNTTPKSNDFFCFFYSFSEKITVFKGFSLLFISFIAQRIWYSESAQKTASNGIIFDGNHSEYHIRFAIKLINDNEIPLKTVIFSEKFKKNHKKSLDCGVLGKKEICRIFKRLCGIFILFLRLWTNLDACSNLLNLLG